MAFTDPAALSGMYKDTYGDTIMNLVPASSRFTKKVPFIPADKREGNLFHQPVAVTLPQGFTYAAFNAGAFSLLGSKPMQLKDAQVNGSQILLQESISYDAASRAMNSKAAFRSAIGLVMEYMMLSAQKRLEIMHFYGRSPTGLATIASATDAVTTTVLTISAASWATGIWAGMVGAVLNIINTTDSTFAGSNTAVATGPTADDVFTITGIDSVNRTITCTATAAGIDALNVSVTAADVCCLVFQGAYGITSARAEANGVDAILTNTGSLFNIDASAYDLWKSNTFSAASGALSMSKVLLANAKAVQRGLDDSCTVWVNPDTWTNLASDIASQRKYDGSYSKTKADNGSEKIEFYAQNGALTIESHNIIKAGDAFILPDSKRALMRVGSQELSFSNPGSSEQIFMHVADKAGYEIRLYTDQALFLSTPAQACKITNIVNATV